MSNLMEKTFITKRITNQDIYNKLNIIENQVFKTNGTVIWHTKALWALFVLICGLIGIVGAI